MDLRIFTEPQQGASHDDLLRVAKATEDLGFDAFFRSDHYLSMGSGSGLPGPSDAWLTLAALARETSRIRLGTLVSPATFRLPGPLAISVAQVDDMSGGRVELGLGAGWFDAEHTAYGIPFPEVGERFARFAEQVEIVHGLLTTPSGEKFSFDGTYYQLTDSPALPKPVQSPHPPLILGGAGKKKGAALAARFADEYNVSFRSLDDDRRRHRPRAARQPSRPGVSSSTPRRRCCVSDGTRPSSSAGPRAIGRDLAELRENGLAGTPSEVVDRIGQFAGVGATRLYLQVLDLSDLDHLELTAAEVLPHV